MEPRLTRNMSFHFLWSSTFASGFADRLAMLAVMVMLGHGITDDPTWSEVRLDDAAIVAAINFFFFLPYMVWGPFAGWLADHLPRKWLMFIADQARGLLILFAFTLLSPGESGGIIGLYDTWFSIAGIEVTNTWRIWALMFSIGIFAATFSPARNSIIPQVVPNRHLQRVNAIVIGMGVIGNLLGFGLGGPLADRALRACILGSALAYLVFGWMWPFLKLQPGQEARGSHQKAKSPIAVIKQIVDGGRYVFGHRPIFTLSLLTIVFWSGTSVIMAAGATLVVDLYGGSTEEFAYIAGGFGLGMLLGAILLSLANARFGTELILTGAMLFGGVCIVGLMLIPSFALGMVMAIATGVCGGLIMICINTTIQQLTPNTIRGRVMGFKEIASDIGNVMINLAIWQSPGVDAYIIPVAIVFGVGLSAMGVLSLWWYVVRGPAPTKLLNTLWRVARMYTSVFHRLDVRGRHHVPQDGGVLLVAKHTSGLDPALIQSAVPRVIRWMMLRKYMFSKLNWLWKRLDPIAVDQNQADASAARKAIRRLRHGDVVCIFPEGGLGPDRNKLEPIHPGVALIARSVDVPMIPVWICDTPGTAAHSPVHDTQRDTSRMLAVMSGYWRLSHAKLAFGAPLRFERSTDAQTIIDQLREAMHRLRDDMQGAPATLKDESGDRSRDPDYDQMP